MPLLFFLFYLFNMLEIRVDAVKYTKAVRRGLCLSDDDVGIWGEIIEILIKAGIISNVILLLFTFNVFEGINPLYQKWEYPQSIYPGFGTNVTHFLIKDYNPKGYWSPSKITF